MTATTLTSELEAINIMLAACDEAPVASLGLTGLYPLDNAKAILSETSRVVQSDGWSFNTEKDYPLSRDPSDNIPLPTNALKVDVDADPSVDPVQRGARLYDRKDHSFVFDKDLTATVTFLLAWDDLPEPARHYITIRAARTMQGRTSVSDSTYKYSADDEQAAWLALNSHETDTVDANMLRDSWDVAQIVIGRDFF
jgi:hypothetical protein